MKKILFVLFSLSLLLSCSSDDYVNNFELITIPNKDKIVVSDGELVGIKVSSIEDISHYDLFVGGEKIKFETMYSEQMVTFPAKYTDGKEVSIFFKRDEQTVQGPSLQVDKSYIFAYGKLGLATTAGSIYIDENDHVIGHVQFSSRNTFISFLYGGIYQTNMNYSIDSKKTIEVFFPTMSDLDDRQPYIMGKDYIDRKGFTKYKDTYYFYANFVTKSQPIKTHHLIWEYNTKTQKLFPYNVIDGDGGMATADMDGFTTDIQVDSEGTLYTLCAEIPAIYKLDKQKGNRVFAGSKTKSGDTNGVGEAARFNDVVTFKMDKDNNIYVAEKNRIRMITPDGTVSTLAGSTTAGNKVGALANAQFNNIIGMAVGPDKRIYILEKDKRELKVINTARTEVVKFKIKKGSAIVSPQFPKEDSLTDPLFLDTQYTVAMEVDKRGVVQVATHVVNGGVARAYALSSIMPTELFRSENKN